LKIVRTIAEMRDHHKGRVGLVPTMGAFHEGHLSLMRQCRPQCDTLVVSLFVNPTQFAPGEDYSRYPRNEHRDAEMAEAQGVDILFAPDVQEMYRESRTTVTVSGISERWEGAHRPGHFDGVATVVCKLFNIVQPSTAFFGLKDLQQCAVIRQMVNDLNMPIQLQFCPTYREADGLAMSSRNAYLSPEDRSLAPAIYKALRNCAANLKTTPNQPNTQAQLDDARQVLEDKGFKVDYFALVDTNTMDPKLIPQSGDSIITAAKIGSTRLIDNVQLP